MSRYDFLTTDQDTSMYSFLTEEDYGETWGLRMPPIATKPFDFMRWWLEQYRKTGQPEPISFFPEKKNLFPTGAFEAAAPSATAVSPEKLLAPPEFKAPFVGPIPTTEDKTLADIHEGLMKKVAQALGPGEDPAENAVKDVVRFVVGIPEFIGNVGPAFFDALAKSRDTKDLYQNLAKPVVHEVEAMAKPVANWMWLVGHELNPVKWPGQEEEYNKRLNELAQSPLAPLITLYIGKGVAGQVGGALKTGAMGAQLAAETVKGKLAELKKPLIPEELLGIKAPGPAGIPEVTMAELFGEQPITEGPKTFPGAEKPVPGAIAGNMTPITPWWLEGLEEGRVKELGNGWVEVSQLDGGKNQQGAFSYMGYKIRVGGREGGHLNYWIKTPDGRSWGPNKAGGWTFADKSKAFDWIKDDIAQDIRGNIEVITKGSETLPLPEKPVPGAAELKVVGERVSPEELLRTEGEQLGLPGFEPPAPEPTLMERMRRATVERVPTEEGEPGIIGLNKTEQNRIRKDLGLDELEPGKRKTWVRTLSEAKEAKLDENALSVADEVVKSQRPISDAEHAGMVLKAARLADEYDASIKTIAEHVEKGDIEAAQMERARADVMIDQLDNLTDAARLGRRETARALSIGRMMVNRETYDLAHVVQEAKATKGARLTPEEHARFERLTTENIALEARLKEIETQHDALLAEKEKAIAERIAKREARKAKRQPDWMTDTDFQLLKQYRESSSLTTKRALAREIRKAKITERTATAKQQIRSDRENIKKQLTAMGFRVNDITGVTTEGAYLVGKLATTYIREGAVTLADVVQKVLIDLPQLTERDVYRSLAMKNPKLQAKAQAEVTARVAQMKTQARLLTEIEDAESGIFQPKRERPIRPEEIKDLQKKLRDLRAEAYRSDIEASRLETALNKIGQLQDQLDNHYRTVRNGKPIEAPELAAAQQKAQEIRSAMRVEDELARLNEQLRTGEFEVKETVEPKVIPPELERQQIELKRVRRQIRAAIDDMAPMAARKLGVEAINTARTLKATADMSGTLRQGLVGTLRLARTDPVRLGQIMATSFKAFFDEYTAEQADLAIRSADHHYIREKSGLPLSELDAKPFHMEEMFMARVVKKIPALGAIIRASNRHMTTYLNMIRTECFDQFLKQYPNATHAELKAWADFVGTSSGRGSVGKWGPVLNTLSLGIFAPRFSASRFQTPYLFFKYLKEPRVRAEIAKDLVTTAGVGATALMLANLGGAEVGLDPRSPDFGKIKVGNTRIDLWAGFQQPIRLVARIGLLATDRAGLTGKDLTAQEKAVDPWDLITRFSSYKLAPSLTIPKEFLTGKTAVGEPVTPAQTALHALIPLVYEDIYDAWRLQGAGRAAAVGGLTFLGVGASTYKDSETAVRREIRRLLNDDNEEGAYQRMFEWNAENPDNQITPGWFRKQQAGISGEEE